MKPKCKNCGKEMERSKQGIRYLPGNLEKEYVLKTFVPPRAWNVELTKADRPPLATFEWRLYWHGWGYRANGYFCTQECGYYYGLASARREG